MIITRNITTAFLSNDDDILLIKRGENRRIAPGVWSGVGGHIESGEINDPQAACIREIYEETGFSDQNIEGLQLRYIILRRRADEIRENYIYFGRCRRRDFVDTDEGTLHWIRMDEVLNHTFTDTVRLMLTHYLAHGSDTADIWVCAASCEDGGPAMHFILLTDWEK